MVARVDPMARCPIWRTVRAAAHGDRPGAGSAGCARGLCSSLNGYLCLTSPEHRLGRCGGIDDRPVDWSDPVAFLDGSNLCRRIGGVGLAPRDAILPGRKVCNKEEADEAHARSARYLANGVALLFACANRVGDNRMTLR